MISTIGVFSVFAINNKDSFWDKVNHQTEA